MAWVRKTLSFDKEVFDRAKQIVSEELGMTMSKFLEIQLRSIARMRTESFKDMMEHTMFDLLSGKQARDNFFDLPPKKKKVVKKKK